MLQVLGTIVTVIDGEFGTVTAASWIVLVNCTAGLTLAAVACVVCDEFPSSMLA
jgi:hypothetical protein